MKYLDPKKICDRILGSEGYIYPPKESLSVFVALLKAYQTQKDLCGNGAWNAEWVDKLKEAMELHLDDCYPYIISKLENAVKSQEAV